MHSPECEREKRGRIDATALAIIPHLAHQQPKVAAALAYSFAVALEEERARVHAHGEKSCKA